MVVDRPTLILKAAGIVAAGWTAGILVLFSVGEGLEGIAHAIALVPLLAVLVLAWRWPLIGGIVIVAVGGLAALAYLAVDFGKPFVLVTELIIFVPPVVGGILFLLAARRTSVRARPAQSPPDEAANG